MQPKLTAERGGRLFRESRSPCRSVLCAEISSWGKQVKGLEQGAAEQLSFTLK